MHLISLHKTQVIHDIRITYLSRSPRAIPQYCHRLFSTKQSYEYKLSKLCLTSYRSFISVGLRRRCKTILKWLTKSLKFSGTYFAKLIYYESKYIKKFFKRGFFGDVDIPKAIPFLRISRKEFGVSSEGTAGVWASGKVLFVCSFCFVYIKTICLRSLLKYFRNIV